MLHFAGPAKQLVVVVAVAVGSNSKDYHSKRAACEAAAMARSPCEDKKLRLAEAIQVEAGTWADWRLKGLESVVMDIEADLHLAPAAQQSGEEACPLFTKRSQSH